MIKPSVTEKISVIREKLKEKSWKVGDLKGVQMIEMPFWGDTFLSMWWFFKYLNQEYSARKWAWNKVYQMYKK